MSTKKRIDSRIRSAIEGGVRAGHRTLFVVVGSCGADQVANLHYMLAKAQVARRPSVLWCYKDELSLSSHKGKRRKQLKDKARADRRVGLADAAALGGEDDPLAAFMSSTEITYAYYDETDRVLGQTFGMCVLQDFEALTPNLLARTVETVSGGGLVVLLLQSLTSLRQLATMAMDSHARYRQEGTDGRAPVARFNERFLLSLASCGSCVVVNDQLDVIPVVGGAPKTAPQPVGPREDVSGPVSAAAAELERLRREANAKADLPGATLCARTLATLLGVARTADQARALTSLAEVVAARQSPGGPSAVSARTTVALTAARGRGKSAALGLAISAAIAAGTGVVYVTAPSPENLRTLFDFALRGLEALGYREHADYAVAQARHASLRACVVRVTITRGSMRQTLQYVQPGDAALIGPGSELLVVDEAAAIPLPQVQALLATGPAAAVVSSTISGYEGTGRSLSLKLLSQLRASRSSSFRDVTLTEPIRYAAGDPIEAWLHALLCLDACSALPPLRTLSEQNAKGAFPSPDACELYAVNRDTLFSFHRASEAFLQRMMALYVSSHYRNTPDDLQLMSDAPAHRLFVLLPPVDERSATSLPDVLAVVQVALEGRIAKGVVMASLARGKRAAGDMIPWTVAQQFQDDRFAALSGARVVRVAVHPELQGMGYGTRAIRLLQQFYSGALYVPSAADADEDDEDDEDDHGLLAAAAAPAADSLEEGVVLRPRSAVRPLLSRLCDKRPVVLDWLGVSFGLTAPLFRFWRRLGMRPVYLRQTPNDVTGEHTAILVQRLAQPGDSSCWLSAFHADFARRLLALLSFQFRAMPAALALDMLAGAFDAGNLEAYGAQAAALHSVTAYDLKRLESYAANTADHHLVTDLLPSLATHHFDGTLHAALAAGSAASDDAAPPSLSPVQAAIVAAMGLQRRSVDDVERELGLPASQVLAMLVKCVRKFSRAYRTLHLRAISPASAASTLETQMRPLAVSLADELDAAAAKAAPSYVTGDLSSDDADDAARPHLTKEQRAMIRTLDIDQYAIADGADDAWAAEIARKGAAAAAGVPAMLNIRPEGAPPKASSGGRPLSKAIYESLGADMKRKAKRSKYAKGA